MLRIFLSTIVATCSVLPAFADQCKWNPKPVVDQAVERLRQTKAVQIFCRPCGDKKATSIVIDKLSIAQAPEAGFFVININGNEPLDLAYTFVPNPGKKISWINLGQVTKCIGGIDAPIELPSSALLDK